MFDEFEDILEKINEARNQKMDLKEHADAIAKVIGIRINDIFEEYQKDIMAFEDKNLRNRVKNSIRKRFERALKEVENYPKGLDL